MNLEKHGVEKRNVSIGQPSATDVMMVGVLKPLAKDKAHARVLQD
jgi:hypothetical protein